MKRSILLVLVAVLALTIGLNGSASAGGSADAQAAAKKGKSKSCKKKGKGKGKAYAGSSAKKKAKGKGCKKGKAKGKGQPKGTPSPGGNDTPAAPGASWPPADGTYSDAANGITLLLKNGGTSAEQSFSGGHGTCVLLLVTTGAAPTSVTASSLTTIGEASNSGSLTFSVKSTMVVTPGLGYEATIDSKLSGDAVTPCDKPGVVIKGTLVKTS